MFFILSQFIKYYVYVCFSFFIGIRYFVSNVNKTYTCEQCTSYTFSFKVNVVSFYRWFFTQTLGFWSTTPILLRSLCFVRMFTRHRIFLSQIWITSIFYAYNSGTNSYRKTVESLKVKDIPMKIVFFDHYILLKNQTYGFPFAFYKPVSKNSDTDLRR